MNSNRCPKVLTLFCLILFSLTSVFSQKIEKTALKTFPKTDTYYSIGEYKKAISTIDKAIKKYKKYLKKEDESPYMLLSDIKRLKYLEGGGQFKNLDSLVSQSLADLKDRYEEEYYQVLALADIIDLYHLHGNNKKMGKYLTHKIESLSALGNDQDLHSKIKLRRLQYYLANKDFNKLRELQPEVFDFLSKNFEKTYSVLKADGTPVTIKRNSAKIAYNKFLYTQAKNMKLASYVYSGNYIAADTLLDQNEKWVKKEGAGKSSLAYAYTLVIESDYYRFKGDIKESQKSLDKAVKVSGKPSDIKLKNYSREFIEFYEKLASLLSFKNQGNDLKKLKQDLEPNITRYYSRRSHALSRIALLKTREDFYEYKHDQSLKDVLHILEEKKEYIPHDMSIITEYLEPYIEKFGYLENKGNYQKALDMYNKFFLQEYDSLTPIDYLKRFKHGIHLIENKNKFAEGDEIYKTYFDKEITKQYHPMHHRYQYWVNTRANTYIHLDEYDKAEEQYIAYDKVVDEFYGKESLQKALSLQQFGELYIKKGLYDTAAATLLAAEEAF